MKSLPVVLIAFGLGFLLYNLRIIHFTPWEILWPALIIWLGVSQLTQIKRRKRGTQDSWEIVLWLTVLTVGIYLLLPNIGITTPTIPWKILWPALLILFGVLQLFPGKCDFIKFGPYSPGGHKHKSHQKSSLIGEFNRGPSSWLLEDMDIRQGIGSVNLDLTQAIIPDREVFIDVSGFVGEASIYLPPGLPFKAECSLSMGEVTVLEHNESGAQRYVMTQSVDYDTAIRKVSIRVHWKVGEISIRQIR